MGEETKVDLIQTLADYQESVTAWVEQSKRETAAVSKLQKAVANGNLRDVEKLYNAAQAASRATAEQAATCEPLSFDGAAYLAPDGGFVEELQVAAAQAGVRLWERDGIIFCYPVLVRPEPASLGVRIDKKLEFNIHPAVLAATLKKLQNQEPKAKPGQFIETLFTAYELERARRQLDAYVDLPLTAIYDILTLLPGAEKDYTLLDFTRDIYFLDISDTVETKKGYRLSLPASTVSRERGIKIIKFVTRDGHEKQYAAIKFTPGQ